jgi:hypothetical protein
MGERAYAYRDNSIWTVLYMGSEATIPLKDGKVKLTQQTNYPWSEKVVFSVEPEKPFAFDLKLRRPRLCATRKLAIRINHGIVIDPDRFVTLRINHGIVTMKPADPDGFVTLSRTWKKGDVVELMVPAGPMQVQRLQADPQVKADVGRVALLWGPVIYCLEAVDNGGHVRNLVLPRTSELTGTFEKDLLGGMTVIRGQALAVSRDDDDKLITKPVSFRAIPYSTWDNRQPGQMVVWLPESPEFAELPGEDGILANGIRIRASHVNPSDTLAALNDGLLPKASNDHSIPRMTWWDHRGCTEWVAYRYPEAKQLTSAEVYWFDDTGRGQCRAPASWRLLWLDGRDWKPVKLAKGSSYGTTLDQLNKVAFEPVTTPELKLEVKLKEGFSGGILEWEAPSSK